MDGRVTIEVGGDFVPFASNQLPAIGTNIQIDGKLTSDGSEARVTVINHEWTMTPGPDGGPCVSIKIRTRPHDY